MKHQMNKKSLKRIVEARASLIGDLHEAILPILAKYRIAGSTRTHDVYQALIIEVLRMPNSYFSMKQRALLNGELSKRCVLYMERVLLYQADGEIGILVKEFIRQRKDWAGV